MKKLKTVLIFNSVIYWSLYLLRTFVIWEFKNPFQWIIDIPTYSNDDRLGLIVIISVIIIFESVIALICLDKEGKWD